MKFPKYWARSDGQEPVVCWHWSDVSVDDALRQANARATELTRKIESGMPLQRYGYGNRPLREEIVQTLGDGGDGAALVTRNAYGVLVLNTARAMFIDVDFGDDPNSGLSGLFRRIMGKAPPESPEQKCLRQISAFAAQHPQMAFRVYRTCAGLRCLVTNQLFDPAGSESTALLGSVGSDPLYVRLCQAQACFRARLTPKPWRCGLPVPPARYPWLDRQEESRFRKWQADYERSITGYAVCRLLQQFGPTGIRPEIQPIVALHDKFTCGRNEHALA